MYIGRIVGRLAGTMLEPVTICSHTALYASSHGWFCLQVSEETINACVAMVIKENKAKLLEER